MITYITDCGNPPVFAVDGINLTYTLKYGNSLEGDFVYYTCPDGYTMSGNNEIECMEGGWLGVQPTCLQGHQGKFYPNSLYL